MLNLMRTVNTMSLIKCEFSNLFAITNPIRNISPMRGLDTIFCRAQSRGEKEDVEDTRVETDMTKMIRACSSGTGKSSRVCRTSGWSEYSIRRIL